MSRVPHDSQLIQATHYDPATRVARVELVNKGTYEYHDVPAEDVEAMRGAKSVGGHFNSVFKGAHGHKAKKVE